MKLKVEWDATQDNNLSEGAHPEGALTRGALKVSEMSKSKAFELLVTLKVLEFEEFQISKKVDVQNNVCDTFEKRVAQGETKYTEVFEKSTTIDKEVKEAREHFENLE